MTSNFGPGVSRVLLSAGTQYAESIWQQGKPPTDSELNLIQSLALEAVQSSVLRGMPSGFLGNETNPQQDFLTSATWSNFFKFGPVRSGETAPIMWANVNGWLIPVAGTRTGSPPGAPNDVDYSNVIALDPPPGAAGDFRIDFVFLEVWKARVQPNPSTTNKPSSSAIYRLGNVEGGFSFLPDDLIDPALGFETNQRVQIQYRVRVVKGLVGLSTNPDGFDPVVVKAQGAALAPTSYTFTNMRKDLGDPGLWRAGDGTQNALGSVDGYSYAVPISVVFRRNGVVWSGNPSQNLNGGFNRNPTANDRSGIKTFAAADAMLAANVTAIATSLTLTSAANLPLPASPATPVLIQIDDELLTYSSITGSTINLLPGGTRGANGTIAEPHKAGAIVRLISGRPDGLFADQITNADVLDLRHMVNPNGFDYGALLKGNLDKLLRGQLRANWKLSGTGPRGSYVHYQDALTSAGVSLGVTKLDAPDNIRMVFSDAATVQPIEFVCQPSNQIVPAGSSADIGAGWSLGLTINASFQFAANKFSAGDIITIPVDQLRNGLQAGATDQVRWLNDGVAGAVRLRLDGENGDLPPSTYTVTPAIPTFEDALTITLGPTFPEQLHNATVSPRLLHITAHVVYGAGRGLARRPDAIHSVSYVTPSADLLTQPWGVPNNNKAARVAWAPLWSKYRSAPFNGLLPVTSEVYADLGSKTVVVSPFRKIDFHTAITCDGRAANPSPTPKASTPTSGTLSTSNYNIITAVASTANVAVGNALIIASGPGAGRYAVSATTVDSITVDRPIRAQAPTPGGLTLTFAIHGAQGLMPLLTRSNAAKWTLTDPLGLFCGTSASSAGPTDPAQESIYVSLPRHLVPGWGEVRTPMLAAPTATFPTGINYMVRTTTGTAQNNYVAYYNGNVAGSNAYSVFSQVTRTLTPLAYNTSEPGTEGDWAGIRFFNDTRGMGRQGLEFPPFYGLARVFGVYQASDYVANASPFTDARESGGPGSAVNLLRQAMAQQDGPPMWIEIDADGDSTYILNAKTIDILKAPTPIANFAAGTYVVEAVVFGFDRGSFDLNSEFRLVLTRPGNANAWAFVGGASNPVSSGATPADRDKNINKAVTPGVTALLPGPATQSDQIVINYSRTVYQGDPWGSQTNNNDLPYAPGPLKYDDAYRLANTHLDTSALTRPNQKVLEVLAATSFSTDLGTGRYSADAVTSPLDFRNVGYEDPAAYPPPSTAPVGNRPKTLAGNFVAADVTNIGSEYLGCTEQLPLGALFRDKDFRGQAFSNLPAPLVYADVVGNGLATGLSTQSTTERQEIPLNTVTSGVGSPGDILVHVDGEPVNYSLLTNYRVTRGGSVFIASGPLPGGALSLQNLPTAAQTNHVNVVHGRAMLVRNTITNVGASEVSAGDELMMLIVTSVHRPPSGTTSPSMITIGTKGAGEGYSAADLYRIEGHPLVRNNVHMQLSPTTVGLSQGDA